MSDLDQHVGKNIRIMAKVVRDICQRSTLEEASEGKLTRNQFTLLRLVVRDRTLPVGEIAEILGISVPAASKNIERLVQLGMVDRKPNPEDRRALKLKVLPAGQKILDRYNQITRTKQSHLLAGFNTEEKTLLLDMLRRIIQGTLAEEQKTDIICLPCGGDCGDECVIRQTSGLCSLPSSMDPKP